MALEGRLRVGEQALDTKASENTNFNRRTPSVAAGMAVDIVTWGSWSNAGQDTGWFVSKAAPGGLFRAECVGTGLIGFLPYLLRPCSQGTGADFTAFLQAHKPSP